MDLIDEFERVAATRCELVFLDDQRSVDFTSVWQSAAVAGSLLQRRAESGSVAMVLDTTLECITCFLGAVRAGLRIVSLPLPPRGGDLGWYVAFLVDACAAADVGLVLTDPAHVSLVPEDLPFSVAGYDRFADRGSSSSLVPRPPATPWSLVQFTSGSTSNPKGVVLTADNIGSNVSAMLRVLDPGPKDVSVSWLPLSHDMGLIGMLLTSLAAAHPSRVGGGRVGLLKPTTFVRSPWRWLRACSELGATVTAAPDFALRIAAAASARTGSVDLTRIRSCIVGAEQVRASTLREFEQAFDPAGLSQRAVCPAYGLAEAGVGVSIDTPEERWTSETFDPDALAHGELVRSSEGRELVSVGAALDGIDLRIDGPGSIGEICVNGPSISKGYLGSDERTGPLATRDQGFIERDMLTVIGRTDDVVIVAGRNIWLEDVDSAIDGAGVARPGRVAAATDADGRLIAAIEHDGTTSAAAALPRVARAIAHRTGVRPEVFVVFERNQLPRTSSGKPRRSVIAEAARNGGSGVQFLREL